jgi:hypothetical protein
MEMARDRDNESVFKASGAYCHTQYPTNQSKVPLANNRAQLNRDKRNDAHLVWNDEHSFTILDRSSMQVRLGANGITNSHDVTLCSGNAVDQIKGP